MKNKSIKTIGLFLLLVGSLMADENTLDKAKILEIIASSKFGGTPTSKEQKYTTPKKDKQPIDSIKTKQKNVKTKPNTKIIWGSLGYAPPSSKVLEKKYRERSSTKAMGVVYTNALAQKRKPENVGTVTLGVNKNEAKSILFY